MIRNLGVRVKLFFVSIALISTVVVATGAHLEGELRRLIEGQLQRELLRHAKTASEFAYDLAPGKRTSVTSNKVKRLGKATDTRITLVAQDGRILADSSVSAVELEALENHNNRPEVILAREQGHGVSRRHSTTLRTDMLYAAVLAPQTGMVVRAAMPLSLVEKSVTRLRYMLLFAAALGLLVAIIISGFASYWLSRTLQALVAQARRVALGESDSVHVSSQDELGTLGQSVNRIAADLRETVHTLVDERDRQSTVLQSMHEGVLALDSNLVVTTSNPAAVQLLGLTRAPVGERLLEVSQLPPLVELAGQARRIKTTAEFEVPGAPRLRILGRGNPLRNGGTVLVLHDVTEARTAESMRRDLVANVSHELRTPVSIIRANSETLLSGALDTPRVARRFVEAIERNSIRLSSLLTDILDLALIEAGSYDQSPETLTPRDILKDLAVNYSPRAESRSVQIINNISSHLKIRADRQTLEQILLNLVENAIKYTYESGTVEVSATTSDGVVRFDIQDDGPGIESQHRDRIFERFYRVDPGRSRELGGTGLGLSIVKHLVSLLGGKVGVAPVHPHGSRFWFTVSETRGE